MERIKGYLIDGGVLLLAALLALLGRYAARKVLYTDRCEAYSMAVITEELGSHAGLLRYGEDVYDNITKRKVGKITDARILDGGRVRLVLDVYAKPRGASLRTRAVWFYYTEEINDEKPL